MNSKISYQFNDEYIELEVNARISFAEEEEIVDGVVGALFDDKGVYHPSRMDYYFWSMILGKYTNFDFDKYSANEIYAIIDDSDIKACLHNVVSINQLHRMQCSIEELVDARLNEHPLKGVLKILKDTLTDGSNAIQKIILDENFRSKLTEYINNNNQEAIIDALNDAAYRDE